MNRAFSILLATICLVGGGCVTNDFKVVDALRVGMTRSEAEATITSFSFRRAEALGRPASGWVTDRTFTDLPGRARAVEETTKVRIETAEYYPVGHGMFGFGQLFLFYDNNGRLVEFYRRQIN